MIESAHLSDVYTPRSRHNPKMVNPAKFNLCHTGCIKCVNKVFSSSLANLTRTREHRKTQMKIWKGLSFFPRSLLAGY